MRYHYEKPAIYASMYGSTHICNHPVYSRCTLYKTGNYNVAAFTYSFMETNRKEGVTWTK